jgi:CRP-like cAMP-binding protein
MESDKSSDLKITYARAEEAILDWVMDNEQATFDEIHQNLSELIGNVRPIIERLKRAGHLREALVEGSVIYRVSLDSPASRRFDSTNPPATLRVIEPRSTDLIDFLRTVPIFSCLRGDAILSLERRLKLSHYRRHEVLVWQGEPSESLYLIRRGVVGITHLPQLVAKPQLLTFLKPGDLLGEVGLLCGSSRSATATALSDVEAYMLSRDDFHDLLHRVPELTMELAKMLGQRLRATNARIRGDSQGQLAIIIGTAPGIGCTSLGCALATTLAHQTGKPTVYTEYPDASRLSAALELPRASGTSDVHPAGAGFDVLVHQRGSATPVSLHTTLITDVLENRYANSVVNVGTFHEFDELSYMFERASAVILVTVPGSSFDAALAQLSHTLTKLKPLKKANVFQVANFSNDGDGLEFDVRADIEIPRLARPPSLVDLAHGGYATMPEAFVKASTTLANRLGRTSEVGIYLPKIGPDGGALHVRQTLELFGRLFGGATCSDATGVWTSPVSGLVADDICIIRSFTTDADLDRHIGDVIDYVEGLKLSLGQEAIAMETNGHLMVI